MSQDERQANTKQERSSKLCQLVNERKIESEIGFEIRKLLAEGLFIDFQDQDRNQKSAIHLAVEKCDVIGVKFLIQFKPNLEVEDEDGRTPLALAELHGFADILNVLVESSFDIVNESYVESIDFESLTRQKIEAIKSRPTFKVLKLINCPSVNEVWKNLDDHDYTLTFNESSHFFFIVIETKEPNIDNDPELMKKVLNLRRPMIVQLSSSEGQNRKIYFKDDQKDFMEISDTAQITLEEFNEIVKFDDDCNMKLLVAALRSNLFGSFNGDLLLTKLNTNEDRSEAVNQFARSNALCHRFFKLFDESQPQVDTIVAALSFKGDQSLLALLDLPFELKDKKLMLNEYQQEILCFIDARDYNLLIMAAESNNLAALKLLLRCGCDFNHIASDGYRASDICWEVDAFDLLTELIEAGSPYPYHFSADEIDESDEAFMRINTMTEAINSFHENIEQGETDEVKKFITSHPHIKHAYDASNKCALTVALQSKEIDIYSLLRSEGFGPGADDEYYTVLDESKLKKEIRKSHKKYFSEAFDEPHLKRLVEKSKLSFASKDRVKCSTIIREIFGELNKIDEIIPILKICSTSDKLRIVFDFNFKYVADMVVETGSSSSGIFYPSESFVYIGARNHETEFCKVTAALIHEMTHHAMRLTYENCSKPYKVGDNEYAERFENVVLSTKKICGDYPDSTDSIIAKVFSRYAKEFWHQELIVRVPQLHAHYKTNKKALEAAERNTPELFHFYRDKTLKDVAAESEVLLLKCLISKINKQTGTSRKIKNLNVQFETVKAFDLKESLNVITSNAPQLTLAMLHQIYPAGSHIFVTLEQVAIGNVLEKLAKITTKESSKETTLIVDCLGWAQKYQESARKLKKIKNLKIIALVMTKGESALMKESKSKVEFKPFTHFVAHNWAELTEGTKVHLLNKIVTFQGVKMALSGLVEKIPGPEAMNFFPLGDILDCKDFKIGHKLHQTSHKFYIPRKFIKRGQGNARSFEELLQAELKTNAMIISDDPGSGKSVTLFEIAENIHDAYPDRWVLLVDLKRHIETFKSVEARKKTFGEFILQHILKNESEFDRELFKEMFRAGKTFILFDGFDEISPNYKDLLLNVLKLFQPASGNQLYITTRPHLESDLEGALGNFVFKLEKFSKESQINFLAKYFESAGFELSHEDFEVLSNRLLEKFSKIKRSEVIGLPLLMRMTAEIFTDGIKGNISDKVDSLNVASLFKEFVNKYFARWTKNENEISLNENVEFVRSGGILEVHHNIALNHIFADKFAVLAVDPSDSERVARVGLIRYDKTSKTFQFIHETFAEYFVADFICFHLERKSRDPSHDCRRTIEVLVELVKKGRGVFGSLSNKDFGGVIRTFLDQTLDTMKLNLNDVSCQSLAKCFTEIVESRSCFYILSESCIVVGENIFNVLLSLVERTDKDFLLKMLESRDRYDNTALLDAAKYGSSKSVSTLCNIILTLVDNPKRIFQQKSGYHNILVSAASNTNSGVLTALCRSLKTVLTKGEIKTMMQDSLRGEGSIIHGAVEHCSDDIFDELLSLLSEYFLANELKEFLRTVDFTNRNFFHRAVECSPKGILKSLINFAKGIFITKKDQKAFFQQRSYFRRNFFHLAAKNGNEEIFQTLIESTCDVLSNDDFRSMLMENDRFRSNVLHLVALNNAKSFEIKLKALNSLLRKFLPDDDLRSLLLQVNGWGKNCFYFSKNTSMNIQVFRKVFGNLWPQEDLTRLLEESFEKIDILHLISEDFDYDPSDSLPNETIRSLPTRNIIESELD